MSNAKHTPGPWEFTEEIGANKEKGIAPYLAFHSIRDAYGACVSSTWAGPNEANARLIAAAPELLDALRAVAGTEMFLPDHPQRQSAYAQARAAIAKATGEKQ